jgi:hypothetical protein
MHGTTIKIKIKNNNGLSGSIEGRQFLQELSNYQITNKDLAL